MANFEIETLALRKSLCEITLDGFKSHYGTQKASAGTHPLGGQSKTEKFSFENVIRIQFFDSWFGRDKKQWLPMAIAAIDYRCLAHSTVSLI